MTPTITEDVQTLPETTAPESNGSPDVQTLPETTAPESNGSPVETPTVPAKARKPKKAGKQAPKAKKPAKAKPKAAKKAAKKAPKAKKAAKPKVEREPSPDRIDGESGNLKEGGTRVRLFRALRKFPGLTAKEIKIKTGMPVISGHLAVILKEELEKGRIRMDIDEVNERRPITTYVLTAAGVKDLKAKKVAKVAYAGVGRKWTKARKEAAK